MVTTCTGASNYLIVGFPTILPHTTQPTHIQRMSDAASDSSDDSDIGAQMQRARQSKKASVQAQQLADSDSDDDDDLLPLPSYKKKKKHLTVEEKMAKLEHRQAMAKRKMSEIVRSNNNNNSDDESSDDDDVVEVVAGPPPVVAATADPYTSSATASMGTRRSKRLPGTVPATKNRQAPRPTGNAGPEILLLDSSDDEKATPTVSLSAQTSRQLDTLRQVKAQFQSRPPVIDVDEEALFDGSQQTIALTVQVSVDKGSGLQKHKDLVMTITASDPLAVVQQAILAHVQHTDGAQCRLRHAARPLQADQTASDYGLESPCTLHANVFVTDWANAKQKAPDKNYGPTLQLVLRRGANQQLTVAHRLREPFAKLIREYGALLFDGERLSPNDTPAQFGTC